MNAQMSVCETLPFEMSDSIYNINARANNNPFEEPPLQQQQQQQQSYEDDNFYQQESFEEQEYEEQEEQQQLEEEPQQQQQQQLEEFQDQVRAHHSKICIKSLSMNIFNWYCYESRDNGNILLKAHLHTRFPHAFSPLDCNFFSYLD
jgi:hypothetical protein